MSRREQLHQMLRAGWTAFLDFVLELEERVRDLERPVRELTGRLALTSTHSGKPPSSDGLAKPPAPRSLRPKTKRKPGGQPGHRGHTLQPVEKPDRIIEHVLGDCSCGQCAGVSLRNQPVLRHEKRQVFELPEKLVVVHEHRAECKRCPVSGREVRAAFPAEIAAPAQYGPRFQAALVYLQQEHAVPVQRVARIAAELLGQPVSAATIAGASERTYRNLASFEQQVRDRLTEKPAVNLDESGLRVAGQLHWVHVVSTRDLTFYGVHPKRGTEAMDYFDIIPRCRQWVLHDHFKPYFTYGHCLHGLCNQHHLRELKFLHEEEGQAWAGELSRFLLHWNQRLGENQALGEKAFQRAHAQYRALLAKGRRQHPRQPSGAQSKAANLLRRLKDYDLSVLAFLLEPEVPFTNNQAERDIRMVKVRQKVSGCFRTLHGARVFARIRGYLSTCRKQGRPLLAALHQAFLGQSLPLSASARGP